MLMKVNKVPKEKFLQSYVSKPSIFSINYLFVYVCFSFRRSLLT